MIDETRAIDQPHIGAAEPRRAKLADLIERVSVPPRRLCAPAPTSDEIGMLVAAALSAPSHGGLRTFRIIQIADTARDRLCDVFEEAEREVNLFATAADIQQSRDKASHAPLLLLMVARSYPDHPDIPLIEQHASLGAALGGLLHGVHMLGYGAMAVSGRKMASMTFRKHFALDAHEEALCFVAIGTISGKPRDKHRPAVSDVLSSWPDGSG